MANIITATFDTTLGVAAIFVASDTGDIYFDADGHFAAGSFVIGSITATEVVNLTAANFSIVA